MQSTPDFSDFIIFGDESGDHGLTSIDPDSPFFVLAFCIFSKSDYSNFVKPAVTNLKLRFWGHDLAIIHNHAIRKRNEDFSFLFQEEKRLLFMEALNQTIIELPFKIIATAIDKRHFQSAHLRQSNLYILALQSCLKQLERFIKEHGQLGQITHLIVEGRGHVDDQILISAFKKVCKRRTPFALHFARKYVNSIGLQLADLVAHPISRYATKSEQLNRAFEVIKSKLVGFPNFESFGLNVYSLENERPQQQLRPFADRELPIHLS